MNVEWLQQNWALIIAGILVVIVSANIATTLVRRSARGQLRNTLLVLEARTRDQATARKGVEKAEKKLAATTHWMTALLATGGPVLPS